MQWYTNFDLISHGSEYLVETVAGSLFATTAVIHVEGQRRVIQFITQDGTRTYGEKSVTRFVEIKR